MCVPAFGRLVILIELWMCFERYGSDEGWDSDSRWIWVSGTRVCRSCQSLKLLLEARTGLNEAGGALVGLRRRERITRTEFFGVRHDIQRPKVSVKRTTG